MVSVPFRGLRGLEGEGSGENHFRNGCFSPLPGFEGSGGKCARLHGHNYLVVSVPFRGLRGLEAHHECDTWDGDLQVSVPFRGLRGLEGFLTRR